MINQDVIDKYLLSECLHPLKVQNKYTKDIIYSPCGHCYSCLKNKSNRDTSLAMNISSHFKYCYFVLLSYEDKYLPYLEVTSVTPLDSDRNNYTFISVDRNLCIPVPHGKDRIIKDSPFGFTHSMTSSEYQDVIMKTHGRYDFSRKSVIYPRYEECDNRIPYCNTSDCQKFLKRLRFHSKDKYDEEIRYYAVSEYGPRTYRPHWHLLLFFNSERLSSAIQQLVHESWSYGYSNCELSRGGSSSYVASYVNSSVCLPSLYLQHKEIKARSFHSKGYGVNHVFPSQASVYEFDKMSSILLNGESLSVNGKNVQVFPLRSYKCTVFPRFSNFVRKSSYSSAQLFSAALFAPERLIRRGYLGVTYDKSTSPVSEFAHAYTNFFLDHEYKGITLFDDEIIVVSLRLDSPNKADWHCLTYNQLYSKFYRLFNMVIRCARFWNLFDYVDIYRQDLLYTLMKYSDDYWNEFARRQLHDYYEFLESCSDEQRSFLFSRTSGNGVKNSSEKIKRVYSYDYSLSDKFLTELTASNRAFVREKVKHKEYNDLSGLLLNV
jgi:hypothetical protein